MENQQPNKEDYIRWEREIKKAYEESDLKQAGITYIEYKTTCFAGIRWEITLGTPIE